LDHFLNFVSKRSASYFVTGNGVTINTGLGLSGFGQFNGGPFLRFQ